MSVAGTGLTVAVMEHFRTRASRSAALSLQGIEGVKSVRVGRRIPYEARNLPAIDVSWSMEQGETRKAGIPGQRMQTRHSVLRVRIVVADIEYPDDLPLEYRLDAIQLEVERRLAANQNLADENGVASSRSVTWLRTDTAESVKGPSTVVLSAVFFQVTASHFEGAPDNTLPEA